MKAVPFGLTGPGAAAHVTTISGPLRAVGEKVDDSKAVLVSNLLHTFEIGCPHRMCASPAGRNHPQALPPIQEPKATNGPNLGSTFANVDGTVPWWGGSAGLLRGRERGGKGSRTRA